MGAAPQVRIARLRPGLTGPVRWWRRAALHPVTVMGSLPSNGPPRLGLKAVTIRFAIQDLAQTLPLALLDRRPFTPSRLPIHPEHHYRAQLFLLPLFGWAEWLLMGGAGYAVLRLSGERADISRVLDVIGLGMLIPMPPLWLADGALIAADRFDLPELGFVNVPVQLWETTLFAIGLHTALDVPWRRAVPAGLAVSAVYVLGASRYVR
ncbi:hypothetical protein [Nocardioides mesophilus]|uniref:Uncharacterized protein n=1 Tax=Nocardioides mesophilus TaxID=433659 RepID=A0A7G9RFG5_9ACTN|nr:hypothetical protein [Nocardioides mesophilus]QNN54340.1 hypothetical protein H9L09_08425 [Nocardioides mesophilus]